MKIFSLTRQSVNLFWKLAVQNTDFVFANFGKPKMNPSLNAKGKSVELRFFTWKSTLHKKCLLKVSSKSITLAEAATGSVIYKKLFIKISQYLQ